MSDERPAHPRHRTFRACISTLVFGTVCLAVVTAVEPSAGSVVLVTMLTWLALAMALAIDFAIDGSKGAAGVQVSLRQVFAIVTCIAVYLSLLSEPWTFRLRFAASRPALDRLAERVAGGAEVEPQWAGLFFIASAHAKESNGVRYTTLYTDPYGEEGFLHPPPQNRTFMNDWSTALQHDADWQHFIKD